MNRHETFEAVIALVERASGRKVYRDGLIARINGDREGRPRLVKIELCPRSVEYVETLMVVKKYNTGVVTQTKAMSLEFLTDTKVQVMAEFRQDGRIFADGICNEEQLRDVFQNTAVAHEEGVNAPVEMITCVSGRL